MTKTYVLLTESEYAAEAYKHLEWLNWVFGLTTFLYAVTALEFKSPWKICAVGLLLWIPMYVYAFKSFPPSLTILRELSADEPNHAELSALIHRLEKKYHGFWAVLKAGPLWISWLLYVVVFASGLDAPFFKAVLYLQL